ncbi:MAG: TolC family outer membrane protein [Thiotrichales bacterium]|nr:TolC family outer membrane protein [Thiotrichales bacterium]
MKAGVRRLARALGAGAVLVVASVAASASDLVEIFELALTSDPEFLAAGADHRAAREILPQALAELRPRVRATFDTRWNERQHGTDYRSDHLTLGIEHPIYRRDRRIAIDQADRRIARADALYAAVRQDLALRVAERYFGVLEAEDELGFAQATLEAFEQQLAQSRQRFEVGLIAITDVEEAKAGFDLSRAQLLAAQNALDIAREALREMTGAYQERLAPLRETHLVMPEPADIDQWTAIALEKNLRLLAARRDMETARQEITRIRAGHAPTLDAVGSFGLNDGDSGGALRETRRADVGLRLSFPLYSGGSILSRTRQSRHRYQRSLDLLERERRRVQRETRDAYLGVDSGISRVQALEQAVRSSQTAAEAIEAGFQVGTRTSVDVLNAQRDLFRARRDLSEARYRYVLDVLRLKRAAGTLSEDDLQLVSIWLG